MLHLTNPCDKRKVHSLTKPKGKLYKTKSLGNYITQSQLLKQKRRSLKLSFIFPHYYYILIYLRKYSEIMPLMIEREIFYVKRYCKTKSFDIAQARYRRKFNFISKHESDFLKLVKNLKAHDTYRTRVSLHLGLRSPWWNVRALSKMPSTERKIS